MHGRDAALRSTPTLGARALVDKYYVWEIISYAWTEIGIEDKHCRRLVELGAISHNDLPQVDRIYFRDVCGSFAVETFLLFPCFLWMLMPDWGYDEQYLRQRMNRWYGRPYWQHFLNPMRWFGYPLAILLALKYRAMLRRVVAADARA
jgi:hypothetical protein